MDYSHYAILLLIVSLGLFFAEVFIPSGGLILVMGLVSLAGALWCGWKAWWDTSPTAWWIYLGSVIVVIPAAVALMLYIFPRTGLGKRILLDAPSPDEVTGYAEEREHLTQFIGKKGRTISLLNPGGIVVVDGERFHCEAKSMLIEPNETVQVVGVKGNRLVVKPAAADAPAADLEPPDELAAEDEDENLTDPFLS